MIAVLIRIQKFSDLTTPRTLETKRPHERIATVARIVTPQGVTEERSFATAARASELPGNIVASFPGFEKLRHFYHKASDAARWRAAHPPSNRITINLHRCLSFLAEYQA